MSRKMFPKTLFQLLYVAKSYFMFFFMLSQQTLKKIKHNQSKQQKITVFQNIPYMITIQSQNITIKSSIRKVVRRLTNYYLLIMKFQKPSSSNLPICRRKPNILRRCWGFENHRWHLLNVHLTSFVRRHCQNVKIPTYFENSNDIFTIWHCRFTTEPFSHFTLVSFTCGFIWS